MSNKYLEIIIGPMYASKTSKLIEIYKKNVYCSIPTIVINHESDTRYSDTMLSTHDKVMIPCIKTNNLFDIWKNNKMDDYSVILINEAQFFEDLVQFVNQMLDKNKKIYIFGLDGDFERKKFGYILDLIPICDKVYKLNSLCAICKDGTLGIFSKRISNEKQQVLVGSDNYIPVCRDCYSK
jgi:thymidine kinase